MTVSEKFKHPCPVCGDPKAFPFWTSDDPPAGCPSDDAWQQGGLPSVRNVSECPYQMAKARQAATWRKVAPEAFDPAGNMLPGGLYTVLQKMAQQQPKTEVVI